jgi:hypoxanthine phosphoribosyltransferase
VAERPDPPRVLLGPDELAATVQRLGAEVTAQYPDGVVLVAVLKGAAIFLADLSRAVRVPCEIDFLAISTFQPDSGRVRIVKDLDLHIGGRDVVLVEDVVDTGLSLTFLLNELRRREPRSLEVCALLDKRARRIVPVPLRFVGAEVPDEFVIGYGLDYAGRYRNLQLVAAGQALELAADPDVYVDALYRSGGARPPGSAPRDGRGVGTTG